MYDVALSVSACLRAGTRTDVAWLVPNEHLTPTHFTESLAITRGGGRIGKVANGIFDGQLLDIAERALSKGRVLDLIVGPLEATLSSLPVGTKAKFAIAPITQFPAELWPLLVGRQSVAIDVNFNEGVIEKIDVYSESDLHNASSEIQEYFLTGESKIIQLENRIITVYRPVPKLVIAGTGAMANAIQKNAELLGWQVSVDPRPENVMGLVANLSPIDSIVIMGHDVENSSTCLGAALGSKAGYIGALGSRAMQDNRAQWLATHKEITDLTRVNGPAGLNIGASTPAQIAISILAQAVAVHNSRVE